MKGPLDSRQIQMATMLWDVCECSGPQHPSQIPELMANQDYMGLTWVQYDSTFQHQTQWPAINTTLYPVCFAGSAWTATRCELSFATTHTTTECMQQGDPDPGVWDCLCTIEQAVLSMTPQPRPPLTMLPQAAGEQRATFREVYRNWNANRFSFPYCCHSHVCSSCRGVPHRQLMYSQALITTTPTAPRFKHAPGGTSHPY